MLAIFATFTFSTIAGATAVVPAIFHRADIAAITNSVCTSRGQYACNLSSEDIIVCTFSPSAVDYSLVWTVAATCSTGNICKIISGIPYCVESAVANVVSVVQTTTSTFQQAFTSVSSVNTMAVRRKTSTSTTTTTTTTTTDQVLITATSASSSQQSLLTFPIKCIYNDDGQYYSSIGAYATSLGLYTEYNVVNLAFWLSSGPADAAYTWSTMDQTAKAQILNKLHSSGKLLLVSAFGATEFPTTGGLDPITTAMNLATFVKANQLDGCDIDYEDNTAMNGGTAEAWLITFMQALRGQLPSGQYVVSHAPQAPYFFINTVQYPNGAYMEVDRSVGSLIDFYNVQFYNQGSTDYASCDTLLTKANGYFAGTSLFEISANGVPLNKLVIGKPVTTAGVANTGYMSPTLLAECVSEAKAMGWNAGVMGWQSTLDVPLGSWISTVAAEL
ncbi:hypothetical protein HDU84_005085 [Entophlyctis sp. JEL0112]|nr:hypothetical protein HDU84_005085 [Entophlyctis sp. JEL0112]